MEKDKDWKKVFNKYISSNLTIKQFCINESIKLESFRYYRNKLELEGFCFKANGHGDKSMEATIRRAEDWKIIFENYKKSNLSIKRFCLLHGLCRDKFRYWKEKLYILEGYDFESPYLPIHDSMKKNNNTFIEFNLKDLESDSVSKIFKLDFNNISITIDSRENKSFIIHLIKQLEGLL